ncbi:MAG: serpin family protein [Polyangiaceae bacterium]|nr:serpin family protein [Polyangiaceae bacterium]
MRPSAARIGALTFAMQEQKTVAMVRFSIAIAPVASPLAMMAMATVCIELFAGCRGDSSPTSTPVAIVDAAPPVEPAEAARTAALGAKNMYDATSSADVGVEADVRAANDFAFKFYAHKKDTAGNVMLSGTSLRRALSAAYLGARGETASEMARALLLSTDANKASAAAKAEGAAWQRAQGTAPTSAKLIVADRLWVEKSLTLEAGYTKAVESALDASVAPLDFVHASEEARTTINGWVAEKTAGQIKELLLAGFVDANTRLVITNAIYFKGKWALPFSKSATHDEAFTSAPGKTMTTPTMHATGTYKLASASGAKALEMRYEAGDLAMLVILPNDQNGIGKLENDVAKNGIDTWTTNLATTRVAVTLPKFTFDFGSSMNNALKALGMKAAFTPNADFSGIAKPQGNDRLYVSNVVHKTWVAVDEEGTEAAAATGVGTRTTGMTIGPVAEFRADHPFLFFIRDTKSGRILFIGRFTEPKS